MATVIGEFATAYLHLMCGIFLASHDSTVLNERYTTTIAGGYSAGTGHRDEPAQNATFSPDFELTYIPKICALLVADRGNRLIRQIKLKPEDCAHENQKDMAGTTTPAIGLDNEALPSTELLGDFVGFDDSDSDGSANDQEEDKETSLDRDLWALLDNPQGSSKKIDSMIEANLLDFSGQDNYSGVSRRLHGGSKVL
ncbi:unnamed protein product [Triticum turgidum subsp. durum]|uniref:Uncharacterized protein n=1 Tax=Triticum turgidum subsp. durum TaxID=4567 RepID=A0A9R1PGA3_TRITD|nr:unnamed protein product [Triticum turgidum subsp. durum]